LWAQRKTQRTTGSRSRKKENTGSEVNKKKNPKTRIGAQKKKCRTSKKVRLAGQRSVIIRRPKTLAKGGRHGKAINGERQKRAIGR